MKRNNLLTILFIFLLAVSLSADEGNIDATNKWAWDTNIGWVNFRPADGGVTVYNDHLEGYSIVSKIFVFFAKKFN